jgi:hypothetical protein
MVWGSGNNTIFAMSTAGQHANPFVQDTFDASQPLVMAAFKAATQTVVDGVTV